MRHLLSLLLIVICFNSIGQTTYPTGLPSPKSDSGFAQYGYVRPLVLGHIVVGDTAIRAKYNGAARLWFNAGVDTALWIWKDTKWNKVSSSGSDCDDCITNISYRAGNYVDTLYYTNANGDTDWYYVPVVDGLISGGIVTYAGFARTYDVSEAFYRINGVFYSSPYTQIVLNALADTDSSRTDLFVVTTSGTATTVEGVESANHLAPQPDLATQIGLTTVTLTPANQDAGVDTTTVYDEDLGPPAEFEGNALNVVTDFGYTASATNIYRGTKSTDVGTLTNNDIVGWRYTSLLDRTSYEGISFFIKLKANLTNNRRFFISFFNGNTQVSDEIPFPLTLTNTTTFQGVSLSLSDFTWSNNLFDSIRYRWVGSGSYTGVYLDNIYLQRGISNGGGGTFVQDVFERNDSLFQVKEGVEYFVALLGSGGTVTSFSSGNLSPLFTTSVATATTTPALSFALSNANAYTVFGRFAGSSGAPSYGQLIAENMNVTYSNGQSLVTNGAGVLSFSSMLPISDTAAMLANYVYGIVGENYLSKPSAHYIQANPVNLATSNVTGVLPIANGGTNNGSLSVVAGTMYYGDGSKLVGLAPGAANQHLTGGTTPVWRDTASGSSGTPYINYVAADLSGVSVDGGVGSNGTDAGPANSYNFFAGANTGALNTYYQRSIVIGRNAAMSMIGRNVLQFDSIGPIALGTNALRLYTGTSPSTIENMQAIAIGDRALANYTTSTITNMAIGGGAGLSISTGGGNVAFGPRTLLSVTNGSNNTAVGYNALGAASGAQSSNTAIGYEAGGIGTASTENTAIGYWAHRNTATSMGTGNVFVGAYAGFNVSTPASNSGTTNVGVGYQAMQSNTSGSNNIGIGRLALGSNSTGSFNIVLGGYVTAPSTTSSGQLNIGNVLYGTGLYQTASISSSPTSAGALSVGISAPAASAILDLTSTAKGFLIPRMTTAQRNAISSPAANLQISNTELDLDNDYNGTVWTVNDGVIFTQSADKNINTTAAETTLFGTGSGTLTLPASTCSTGNTILIKLQGYMTTDGTPTLDIKFKLGATTIASTGAVTLVSVAADGYWEAECTLTVRANPGAAVAVSGQGLFRYFDTQTSDNDVAAMTTATVNAATNGSLAIDVTATWGASHANNKIVCTNAVVTLAN